MTPSFLKDHFSILITRELEDGPCCILILVHKVVLELEGAFRPNLPLQLALDVVVFFRMDVLHTWHLVLHVLKLLLLTLRFQALIVQDRVSRCAKLDQDDRGFFDRDVPVILQLVH